MLKEYFTSLVQEALFREVIRQHFDNENCIFPKKIALIGTTWFSAGTHVEAMRVDSRLLHLPKEDSTASTLHYVQASIPLSLELLIKTCWGYLLNLPGSFIKLVGCIYQVLG